MGKEQFEEPDTTRKWDRKSRLAGPDLVLKRKTKRPLPPGEGTKGGGETR